MDLDDAEWELDPDDSLEHIGIKRRSGRYPWGSGGNEVARSKAFRGYYDELKEKGLTEAQIVEGLGLPSSTELRATIAASTEILFSENQSMAARLSAKKMSNSAIAERMLGDKSKESTIRGWLAAPEGVKEGSLRATAESLKSQLENKPFLDVGKGTEHYLGITDSKLKTSIALLRDEGYELHEVYLPQLGTGKYTRYKILTKEGITKKEAYEAAYEGRVQNVHEYSDDGGLTFKRPELKPVSLDLKRVEVRYGDEGGAQMDGVIELRRGVDDISLGANKYAQVRMAVNDSHYLKGMAIYATDLPDGVDVRFNTNKKRADAPNKTDAMKPFKTVKDKDGVESTDTANPFGATTKKHVYLDKNGKEKTSVLNMVNEEGRWDEWSKSLSSQMLSKQSLRLAADRLAETRVSKQKQLDEIMALTNPVVKKKMLDEFAETADSDAVHLKAAALPRQSSKVLLPMNSMRPNEIFAPDYDTGDKVVLVRYPHGGPFEIPELTVNNRNLRARAIMGGARDAVGIHHSVAEQLSGADFDGDAVLVIPNNDGRVKTRPPLAGLKNFDPKEIYPNTPGMRVMKKEDTQREMGRISNLITDMTIHKADDNELAAAVRHSMVVIDAEKHKLNYKQSEQDNGIAALKKKYQTVEGRSGTGAATIISRASSDARVPEQRLRRAQDGGPVDPKTGKLVWEKTGASTMVPDMKTVKGVKVQKTDPKTGEPLFKEKFAETKGSKMEFTDDAFTLSSGQPMENLYAAHANSLKGMANQARKTSVSIKDPKISKAAKALYSKEVESLNAKLQIAQRNAPIERRAQTIGNAIAKARIDANPQLDKDDIKKIRFQSLEDARIQTGATKKKLGDPRYPEQNITSREWEAIQAGAIASTRLREILSNADMNRIKELATPRARTALTPGQMARAKSMRTNGKSLTDIAAALGIPRSTLTDNLNNG